MDRSNRAHTLMFKGSPKIKSAALFHFIYWFNELLGLIQIILNNLIFIFIFFFYTYLYLLIFFSKENRFLINQPPHHLIISRLSPTESGVRPLNYLEISMIPRMLCAKRNCGQNWHSDRRKKDERVKSLCCGWQLLNKHTDA